MRFTLASGMAFILFLAVGFAALRSASALWSSGIFSLTLAILVAAMIGAVVQRGTDRMAWAGFALCGWVYMIGSFGPWFNPEVRLHLISTTLLDELYPRLHNRPVPQPFQGSIVTKFDQEIMSVETWLLRQGDKYPHFQRIGHSIAALLTATIGGVWTRLLATRSPRPSR